jgi:flagellar basal body-associated protein FliL
MAEESETPEDGEAASGKKGGMLIWIVVMVISIVGGAATPIVLAGLGSKEGEPEKAEVIELDPEEEFEVIEFDEVTVNLDEARFSRYLRINFALKVGKSQMVEVQKQLDAKSIICKNWLQTHIAEKSTDDLRGRYGRNRIRREILDYFNEALFADGIERIQDILIIEFHVQ